jgi:hypothetical protein
VVTVLPFSFLFSSPPPPQLRRSPLPLPSCLRPRKSHQWDRRILVHLVNHPSQLDFAWIAAATASRADLRRPTATVALTWPATSRASPLQPSTISCSWYATDASHPLNLASTTLCAPTCCSHVHRAAIAVARGSLVLLSKTESWGGVDGDGRVGLSTEAPVTGRPPRESERARGSERESGR